jgi:hypothetical protein
MDIAEFNATPLDRWRRYFPGADVPLAWFYTDRVSQEELEPSETGDRCLICNVARVREVAPCVYDARTSGFPGGKRHAGFAQALGPGFEHFLSCGIPGEIEDIR